MRAGQSTTWAVIAGGGTGGHIYPGLAIANELVSRGHERAKLRFVGSRRGLEASTGALLGFPVTLLPGRGWRRELSAAAALANAQALFGLAAAVLMAVFLFARWRPAVVVSLGGYASFACVVAAAVWRVPVVVVSLDAVPGLVNRLAARFAAARALGVPSEAVRSAGQVEGPRWQFTGVPVRPEIVALDRSPLGRQRARQRLGLPLDAKVVVVSGGSLGSLRINRAVARLTELWAGRHDVAIRHVVGRRDWGHQFGRLGPPKGALVYQPVAYEEDMASFYSAADVAVQRAGASAVAELALAGLPSVLVPLPGAPGDHQRANARAMQAVGGAVVVEDAELDGERLAQELDALLSRPSLLSSMAEAARVLARPAAAQEIADLVERSARAAATLGQGARERVAGVG